MKHFSFMHSKTFLSYLLSFVSIVLFPLMVIGLILNFTINNSAQAQYIEFESQLLHSINEQIDSNISHSVHASNYLANNLAYKRIISGTAVTAYVRQECTREISGYLSDVIGSSGICKLSCLYFKDQDMLVASDGSTYTFAQYYSSMLDFLHLNAEQFNQIVSDAGSFGFCPLLFSSSDEQEFLCLVQVIPSAYLNRQSYLLSFYSVSSLRYIINKSLPSNSYFSVYSPSGDYLTGTVSPENVVLLPQEKSSDPWSVEMNGTSFLAFREISQTSGLQLVFCLPKALVLEKLIGFEKLFIIVIAVVLLIGIILAVIMAYFRYAPVKKLYLQICPNEIPAGTEFEQISQRLTESKNLNVAYVEEIKLQYRQLQNQILIHLLTVETEDCDALLKLMSQYNISFKEPLLHVIAVRGHVENAFEPPRVFTCQFPVSDYSVWVVNDSEEKPCMPEVVAFLRQLQANDSSVCIGISSPCSCVTDLRRCFQDALSQLNSMVKTAVSELSTVFYPIEEELKIMNTLSSGDFEACKAILTSLKSENLENRHLSVPLMLCLYHNMTATACRVYNNLNNTDKSPLQYMEYALSCEEPNQQCFESILQFYSAVSNLCACQQANKAENTVNAVVEYIRQHYIDSSLSLDSVAGAFNVSYYYLSHMLRDESHQSFSNLLNGCRIEQAKTLLTNSLKSAQDIAFSVGYTNTNTFFRVFRKITGTTPQQYRQLSVPPASTSQKFLKKKS